MFRIFPPLDLGVLGLRPPTGAEDRVIVISKEMLNEDIEINPGAKEGGPGNQPGNVPVDYRIRSDPPDHPAPLLPVFIVFIQ